MSKNLFDTDSITEQKIIFSINTQSSEIMSLDSQGMLYKGKRIEDAGEAYNAWMQTMAHLQSQWHQVNQHWAVAFSSPWDNGIEVKVVEGARTWKEAFEMAFPRFYLMVHDLDNDLEIAKKQVFPNGFHNDDPFEFNVTAF